MTSRKEGFFTNAEVAAMFPGTTAEQLEDLVHLFLERAWPETLPKDFDHQVLDRIGLRGSCTLMQVPGGWQVENVQDLATRLFIELVRGE